MGPELAPLSVEPATRVRGRSSLCRADRGGEGAGEQDRQALSGR